MKKAKFSLDELFKDIPPEIREQTELTFAISDRIYELMQERGLSKKQFAEALGKRPCEVTKWLSGEHNFTIATIAMLSTFFGKPVIAVV